MTDKYYKFTDAHPTGGVATVTITEHQILEHMRQFTDYTGFTDDLGTTETVVTSLFGGSLLVHEAPINESTGRLA